MMSVQEILNSIDLLSAEEREQLFELIHQRQVEERRTEIAANEERLRQAVKMGTAKSFDNFEGLKSYLLADDDE